MRSTRETVAKKLHFGDETEESKNLHHDVPLSSPILIPDVTKDNQQQRSNHWLDVLCQYHVGGENIPIVLIIYIFSCLVILTFLKHPHYLSDFSTLINAKKNNSNSESEDTNNISGTGMALSVLIAMIAGITCCGFSWTITYFDSLQPGQRPPTPVSPCKYREKSGHNFHMNYAVAIGNGSAVFCLLLWWLPGWLS